MVELRKRKEPAASSNPLAAAASKIAKKLKPGSKKADGKTEGTAAPAASETAAPAPEPAPVKSAGPPAVGSTVTLAGFGGTVATNDDQQTTLAELVEKSKGGVVLFTYPKASTPGCTTQVCLFRDSYAPLTATGLDIYGLSADSPKANTTFKTKQNLPYALLCDPKSTLIGAIGMKKQPSGTTRGVFVIDKQGKVLAAEPGGPAATVEVVKKLVETGGASGAV